MRKTVIILGFILAAQVLLVSSLFAEHPLQTRIVLFARAFVSEEMRVRKISTIQSSDMTTAYKLKQMEEQIYLLENKVQIYVDLNRRRKTEVIQEFRKMLFEKCCRLAGTRAGGGGGGGGGGGKRRAMEQKGGG